MVFDNFLIFKWILLNYRNFKFYFGRISCPDIRRRLDELNRKNALTPKPDPTTRTILELQQKEAENQKTLNELKSKLENLSSEGWVQHDLDSFAFSLSFLCKIR